MPGCFARHLLAFGGFVGFLLFQRGAEALQGFGEAADFIRPFRFFRKIELPLPAREPIDRSAHRQQRAGDGAGREQGDE